MLVEVALRRTRTTLVGGKAIGSHPLANITRLTCDFSPME
jgi:hypothetical protein